MLKACYCFWRIRVEWERRLSVEWDDMVPIMHGRRNRGVWGTMLGPAGYRGTGGTEGSNENDLCLYSRQSLFSTVQVTEFQLPWVTLVDTCQVNDIWKDGLGCVSTVYRTGLLHYSNLHAKSDWALYKVWHIAAELSHEINLAITKLSLSLIHNTIGLGLPIFSNATTRQQISIYSTGPYWYLLACTPHIWKSGGTKTFFRELFCTPHFEIRGTAPAITSVIDLVHSTINSTPSTGLRTAHWFSFSFPLSLLVV